MTPTTDQARVEELREAVKDAMSPHGYLGEHCVSDIIAAVTRLAQPQSGDVGAITSAYRQGYREGCEDSDQPVDGDSLADGIQNYVSNLALPNPDSPPQEHVSAEAEASEIGCICGDGECREWLSHGDNALRHSTPDFELMADGYKWRSGKSYHTSDCATSNAPALMPGPCDCDAPPQADSTDAVRRAALEEIIAKDQVPLASVYRRGDGKPVSGTRDGPFAAIARFALAAGEPA